MRYIICIVLFSGLGFAETKHKHHSSHVHGAASLNIAIDKLKGRVEFKAASEAIVGFEHKAKSEVEKKKLKDITEKFEKEINSIIQFDPTLGCVFTKEKIEMTFQEMVDEKKEEHEESHHGEHSDFIANYTFVCEKEVKGTNVTFNFSQFKQLKDLDVIVLADDLQKSIEVKGKPVTLELK